MPSPPSNLKRNNLTPDFLWNSKARQYINAATGRFVSRETIRQELDQVIDASDAAMRALSQRLVDGKMDLAEWQTQMMQQIKTTHLAAGAMQRGGWQQMTQSDYGRVGQIVRREYAFLRDFAGQISNGTQKLDGSLVSRAGLYGQGGRTGYHRFWRMDMENSGFDQERSILNPAEHCQLCIEQAELGWQPIGQMIPIGSRTCLSNDRCDVEYKNTKTGETIRV
jgi:hypothetical protein